MYNLEYHKWLDRSHILPNFLSGARAGVYSQFISDIIISLLLYNEAIIIEDIKISDISSYYAAVASGITGSVLAIYLDPFALVLFTITAYTVVKNYIEAKKNNTVFSVRPREIIFDAGVSIILIFLFDEKAHTQYLRYSQKRHFIEPNIPRRDRTAFESTFFSVLISTYSFLKLQNNKAS